VLACLWEADGRVTLPFFQRFYALAEGVPRDEALRQAQVECLREQLAGAPASAADPVNWAGFVLHGNPGTLAWKD
jgi:CHAT domain-containing protein